jgi:hypothetical protein
MIFDLLKTLHLVNFRSLIDFVPTPGLYGKDDIAHGGFFDAKLAMGFDGFVFHKPVRCAIIRLFPKQRIKENSRRCSGR